MAKVIGIDLGTTNSCVAVMEGGVAEARARGRPCQIHAGEAVMEHLEMTRRTGKTSVRILAEAGLLGPDVTIGHGIFLDHHSWLHWPSRDDVRLLADAGIARNRLKVASAVTNAQALLAVRKEFGSFDAYLWQFVGHRPHTNALRHLKDVPASTPESEAMSKDLKGRGFKFVGSTICYAFMQATGMVNDHTVDCFRYSQLT